MKLAAVLFFAALALADEPKPKPDSPEVAALKAEIESLKAQVAQIRLELNYSMQVCSMPDVMAARLTAIEATKKAEVAKAAAQKAEEKDKAQ